MLKSVKMRPMDNEDKKKLLGRLRKIAAETEAAIRELEVQVTTGELPVCPYCGLEIQPAEKTKRQVHTRCYFNARNLVESGETTWKKLETEGRVGKGSKGGRQKKAVKKAEAEIEATIAQRRVKRKRSGES